MDEFSALCGSEQMSMGFGGVQVPREMLLAGAVGVPVTPSPVPTRARPQRGPVMPRVLGRALGAAAGDHWGQGDVEPASQDLSPKDPVLLATQGLCTGHSPCRSLPPGLRPLHHSGLNLGRR